MMTELVEIAILAFRGGRHRDAIELLLQAIDVEKDNWMAMLYLAMSYQKSGRTSDAHRVFKHLAIVCPDDHIRFKAQNTMPLLDAELRRRFHKDAGTKQVETNINESITSLG
jgi:tetratricopeptide (TPR) repeat protein